MNITNIFDRRNLIFLLITFIVLIVAFSVFYFTLNYKYLGWQTYTSENNYFSFSYPKQFWLTTPNLKANTEVPCGHIYQANIEDINNNIFNISYLTNCKESLNYIEFPRPMSSVKSITLGKHKFSEIFTYYCFTKNVICKEFTYQIYFSPVNSYNTKTGIFSQYFNWGVNNFMTIGYFSNKLASVSELSAPDSEINQIISTIQLP